MKKVLAFSLLLLVVTCTGLIAAVNNWALITRADDGLGNGPTSVGYGVKPTATDGVDSSESLNHVDLVELGLDSKVIAAVIDGHLYSQNFMSPALPETYPQGKKTWEFRVAGLSTSDGFAIRLRFETISTSTLPPSDYVYKWKMVDNRGITGAPANGTEWVLLTPDTAPSGYFTLTLPNLRLSSNSESAMLSQGYDMEFTQEAVPEPASVLALGSGLIGLAGIFRRRR